MAAIRDRGPRLALLAFACGAATGPAGEARAGAEVRIAAVLSQDAAPFQQALDGFRSHLDRQGIGARIDVYALHGDAEGAAKIMQRALEEPIDLILTLGSLGTQTAVREARDVPIVAGMVLDADDLGGAPNATAVVLDFPPETELRWLQRLLPGPHRIGVLYNPSENQVRIDAAVRAARAMGISLYARSVVSPKELPDALGSLNNRADVLWGVADPIVLNPQTAKPILLFALRNRIAFVGLSEAWVKAGALYALDRDYRDIGAQCGELALKILQGAAPRSLPPVPPRKVLYSVNLRTARHLKLDFRPAVLQNAQAVVE
jgi:putative ABC transport system substrate-binding protein